MKPVGVAVVGAGYWGPNLVRNFAAHNSTDVRWVCDLSLERAARTVGPLAGVKATVDLQEVLADPEVEAVAIATPAGTHAALAAACFEAGKHVLVEKPLARTVEEGERMVATAESLGLVLMTDHTFCYTGAVRKIRDLVKSGSLGDLQYFDSVRINLGLIQSDIDVFWDLAPHDLSILDFILPDDVVPLGVSAQGADPLGVGHPCVGFFSLPLSNGSIAHAHVNWLSPTKVRTTTVGGSKKMLVWDDLKPAQRISVFDTGVELEPLDDQARRRTLVSYRTGEMVAPVLDESEALKLVAGEFASAIREGRAPLTDGRAGLRVLKVLAAIHDSLAAGGATIPLDLDA
ncbi:MAG: Gfo/Idh/MocA family oxidoreductase [Acidimicrobiia bacterium]|nr:Gfo/Idh/MocA family oxidoreductase [Acidimicrobiia bacterium]